MKKWLAVGLVLVLTASFTQAQLAWNVHQVDGIGGDYLGGRPWVKSCDVDQDGDMDMYGYAAFVGGTHWWSNNDGVGGAWTKHTISNELSTMDPADMDGDGDLDMIGAKNGGHAYWWENSNGLGTDWVWHPIALGMPNTPGTSAADMDGDGDIDLAVMNRPFESGRVIWFENQDNATTWVEHSVDENFVNANFVLATDVDGDGDTDLIGDSYGLDGIFAWWSNEDGLGLTWTYHELHTGDGGCWGLDAADLDGDGDTDILGSSYFHDTVFWWQQSDDGSFTTHEFIIYEGGYFPMPHDVIASDVDGDGDLDVLCAMAGLDCIAYWENVNGDASVWVMHRAAAGFDEPWGVDTGDFNGDGLLDICSTAHDDGYVKWWEQPSEIGVTVIPTASTVIPATGGMLEYSLRLVNDTMSPRLVTWWTMVQLPNGELYGPTHSYSFSMPANTDITVPGLGQPVPSIAPEGEYAFISHVGSMTGLRLTDVFGFSKAGQDLAGDVRSWSAGDSYKAAFDQLAAGDPETALANEFALSAAWPNPFNAATTLTITLPETSELTVMVYNVAGQQVAQLADGSFNAGTHELTFDASGLASGLYFVRATVPGQMTQTQKVMLVR
ncbi:T9SS type A sorting domain-containing protein [bacterium]|nr:T9SS type A sorting domain-containing protein [bacterium]